MNVHDTNGSLISKLAQVLNAGDHGLAVDDLIEAGVSKGYSETDVVRAVRGMMNRGDVGLDAEMRIVMAKVMA